MRIEDFTKGRRIEYKFTEVRKDTLGDGTELEHVVMQYATTPVFTKKKDLNQKLTELNERENVIEIVVVDVMYWSIDETP